MYYTPDSSLEAEIARLDDLGLSELRDLWAERLSALRNSCRRIGWFDTAAALKAACICWWVSSKMSMDAQWCRSQRTRRMVNDTGTT